MIHFDERRHPPSSNRRSKRWSKCNSALSDMIGSRPADEEPLWRTGWGGGGGGRGGGSGKPKRHRKKDAAARAAAAAAPKTHRIDVFPEYKSGPYRNVYWMHPNLAITRESRGQEEFVGEYTHYAGLGCTVIVNFFTGLDFESTKLRYAHTAHTPPSCRSAHKASDEYLRRNMETLLKKLDVVLFQQVILDSARADH